MRYSISLTRPARHLANIGAECRCLTTRRAKPRCEQHQNGRQIRSRATANCFRKLAARGNSTPTGASMPLVFRDNRSNLNIPDLVAKRCGVGPLQPLSTSTAGSRETGDHFLTIFHGNQRALEFIMPRLAATSTFGFRLLRGGTFACGCSEDGGFDQLRDVLFNRVLSSSILASTILIIA